LKKDVYSRKGEKGSTMYMQNKRFDVRVKALIVLDVHSIRIKCMWERRINERVWKWHNAYGSHSISRIF
jgi:hypothetical protein